MKELWVRIGQLTAVVAIIALIVFLLIRQETILDQQLAAETQRQDLKAQIIRSETITVDDEQLAALLDHKDLQPVLEDLDRLRSELRAVSSIMAQTPGRKLVRISSHSQTPRPDPVVMPTCPDGSPCPNLDPFGYLAQAQQLELTEPFENQDLPFGTTEFRAWEEKPWSVEVYPREYSVTTVLSQDEQGNYNAHNQFAISVQGEKYPISLKEAKLYRTKPEAKFRFSPKLYLGADVGVTVTDNFQPEVVPSVSMALFSYGETIPAPDWTFVQVGVGYATQQEDLTLMISPINYNIGQHVPIMTNTQIGPSIQLTTSSDVAIMGGIRVGF